MNQYPFQLISYAEDMLSLAKWREETFDLLSNPHWVRKKYKCQKNTNVSGKGSRKRNKAKHWDNQYQKYVDLCDKLEY